MAAGELPFETVDTFLLWLVYFGVPASFIAVRQVLIKRTCTVPLAIRHHKISVGVAGAPKSRPPTW